MTRRIYVLACAALTACSAASASLDSAAVPRARPRSLGTSEFVPIDELRRYPDAGSLLDVLQRVRPGMVRPRPVAGGLEGARPDIDVFINGQYAGSSDVLRMVQPQFVASVRMQQRSEAFLTHGSWLRGDHALFVTLLR
ncbi:MAG: hypothetical protein H7066_09545 [Cytophagaceae bacterium]|nr:hypothetical protein [Gemmatimonadaceae bacterium]